MPEFWEEAAHEAAERVREEHSIDLFDLDVVEYSLSKLRSADRVVSAETRWVWVAADALRLGGGDLDQIVETIISKQHDYGHENILWGGQEGVAIRAHDKVARIRHLTANGVEPKNESLQDSWCDLVGYALIGYMLAVGTFELPLRPKKADLFVPYEDLLKNVGPWGTPEGAFDSPSLVLAEQPIFDEDELDRIEEIATDVVNRALAAHSVIFHPTTITPRYSPLTRVDW